MWLLLAAVILGVGPDAEMAVAQFKKVEQQVLKAKALQSQIDMIAEPADETFMAMRGRLLLVAGNKVRLELEGEIHKKKDKIVMFSE